MMPFEPSEPSESVMKAVSVAPRRKSKRTSSQEH